MTVSLELNQPINLQTVEDNEFLFYLAGRVPVSPANIAVTAVPSEVSLVDVLRSQYPGMIETDPSGYIRLTAKARPGVVKAGINVVRDANEDVAAGKSNAEAGDYESAVDAFQSAEAKVEAVVERFNVVDYESEKILDLLEYINRRQHDAGKQVAREPIEATLEEAEQLETTGEKQCGGNSANPPEKPYLSSKSGADSPERTKSPGATSSIATAEATEDGESDSKETDRSSTTLESPSLVSSTDTEGSGSTEAESLITQSHTFRSNAGELDAVSDSTAKNLERAGFETVGELTGVSKSVLTDVDGVGPMLAGLLLDIVREATSGGTTPAAGTQANDDNASRQGDRSSTAGTVPTVESDDTTGEDGGIMDDIAAEFDDL
ncbi:hypothetical protein [Haloarchaeobius litoreus]|uniref:Helix-hairpin-helix domain-containing protein n=1 Tax=Haloarchaeobius litoreus TaxID=755306 RepID=A0ABD6DKM4_9EURY|nr:hypothetical protein [Haloarchaeobius litoreus]